MINTFTKAEFLGLIHGYDTAINAISGTPINIEDLINATGLPLWEVAIFVLNNCEMTKEEKEDYLKGIVEVVLPLNPSALFYFNNYVPPIDQTVQVQFGDGANTILAYTSKWQYIREMFLQAQEAYTSGKLNQQLHNRLRAFKLPYTPEFIEAKAQATTAIIPDYTGTFDDLNAIVSYITTQNTLAAVWYLFQDKWPFTINVVCDVVELLADNGNTTFKNNLKTFITDFV